MTPPFQPLLLTGPAGTGGPAAPDGPIADDWRIYARSASDDKAGVMAILAAVDALRAEGRRPSFNLKIVLEGEEEAGSPNLAAMLRRHRDTLGLGRLDHRRRSRPPVGTAAAQPRRARRRQHGSDRLRTGAPAPQRPLRQLGAQSGDDARRAARLDEGRDRAGDDRRLLRRRRAADRGRAARDRRRPGARRPAARASSASAGPKATAFG